MGKLENKRDVAPYRNLKTRIEMLSLDPRYAFMFGSLTVYDGMAQILGRIFRVPVEDKPITILELTGLPTEIVNVVVSVLCRMTFDFALWGEGKVPVTLVCEEAHRYVPANPTMGFEPCKRAIAKIAKEGRKYGASLCDRHAAPGRDRSDDPVPVQHGLRAAHVQRPRPGDRQVGDLGHGLGPPRVPVRARPARGDRLRRRRDAAGPHPLRRPAQARHAAQLIGDVHDDVAAGRAPTRASSSRSSTSGAIRSAVRKAVRQTAMFADAMGLTTPGATPAAPAPQPALEPAARRYPTGPGDKFARRRQATFGERSTCQRADARCRANRAPPAPAPAPAQASSALRSLRDRLNQRGGSR